MEGWLDRMAEALGEPPPTPAEVGAMLRLSRDVARGIERKLAPLSTFVAGMYIAHATATGTDRAEALRRLQDIVTPLVPPPAPEPTMEGGPS